MRSIEEVHKMITTTMAMVLNHHTDKFSSEYSQGVWNGLELVCAYMENRPAFHKDINKKHLKQDLSSFPEYFV